MKVKVEYSAQMRKTIGRASEELEIAAGDTVCDLIGSIARREGEPLQGFLLGAGGEPSPSILLFLNDVQVEWCEAPSLADGDVLTIASPIAGGIDTWWGQ